jgi:cell division septation protein DedD
MRTLYDTEEEEIEGKASEITLSTASLLGVFFGLVLICGVFFGFGYSMGRGTGAGALASGVVKTPTSTPAEADETAAAVTPPAPSPEEQQAAAPAIEKSAPPAPVVKEDSPEEEAPAKPAAPVSNKPSAGRQPAAYLPPTDAPPSASGQPMVQIAAVARREDADVLVSALRQRGYGVVVRNEPQDKLLHVQVGPFADRVQATAIKQKLLSDGYNAIIKQ